MTRLERWVAGVVFVIGFSIVWRLQAQQQNSGGSAVTQSGVWTVQPGKARAPTA